MALATMRPPLASRMRSYRSAAKAVDLDGKRILLTGASSGIGECAAEEFARHGAVVVAVARRQDLLDALVGRINASKTGAECQFGQGGGSIFLPCSAVKEIRNGRGSGGHSSLWHEKRSTTEDTRFPEQLSNV